MSFIKFCQHIILVTDCQDPRSHDRASFHFTRRGFGPEDTLDK